MTPRELVSVIDFRYITDALTPVQALEILRRHHGSRAEREREMLRDGYPAYTTSAGWLGYPDDKIRRLCRDGVAQGWSHFKIKVGRDLDDDLRRAAIIREEIGPHRKLMLDANQIWDVNEAIERSVPVPVITASLFTRFRSRDDNPFAERLLAALRNQFGGHAVRKRDA